MKTIPYNMGVTVAGRLLANALGFLALMLLTRLLGAEDFGRYSTVYAYLFFVAIAADMGLGSLLTREISRSAAADETRITGLLATLRLLFALGFALAGVLVASLSPYETVIKWGILIASASTIFQSMTQVFMGVFQKHLKISVVAIGDVVTRIVQLCGLVFLIWKGFDSLLAILWINVLAEAAHLTIIFFSARKIVPFSFAIDTAYWKKILRDAFPIAISLVFTLLYFKIDTIMLSFMRTAAEVGLYSVAYKILEMIIFFPAAYVGLVMPLLSKNADSPELFRPVFWKSLRVLSVGAVAAIVILLIFAEPITKIAGGENFAAAANALRVLALAAGVIFLGNLGGNGVIALNLQKKAVWIYGLGAVFNIAANFILIPRYGYMAAAWTTVITETMVTINLFWLIYPALSYKAGRL